MAQPLDNILVLDFSTGWPGSVATMIMSDFGAEVIKIEPPSGDQFRQFAASSQWNRGKKSIVLDLKNSEDQTHLKKLLNSCDVVVESYRPGVAKRLGVDYETLSADRPDLIYCSITGWGPKGPYSNYKGYEGLVAAKIGRMVSFGGQTSREGPHYSAVQTASHSSAMAAFRGVLSALLVRDRTGQGQKIETSLLQALALYDFRDWIIWQLMVSHPDKFPEDPWGSSLRMPTPGYMPIRTKDGHWIQMANIVERPFHASMRALGLEHIYEDPRFEKAPMLMEEDAKVLRKMMLEKGVEKTLDEWMQLFVNKHPDVAAEPFMTTDQGMEHPQMLFNEHVQTVEDPDLGKMRQLGPISLMQATPGTIKGPAPSIGEHTSEILGNNQQGSHSLEYPSENLPKHPLEGIVVLDLATVIAGPLSCALLAELGARVIRIEPPAGDFGRRNQFGIITQRTMAGTESLSMDMKTDSGSEIMQKLVASADVLIHNMRPGAMERLGIGYEQVKTVNPRLVYVYAGGYGNTGPYSHRPSMHPIPGAVCGGAMAQLGKDNLPSNNKNMNIDELYETARMLGRANEGNPDPNSSMAITASAMLGLYHRERSGKGQYIVSTMLQANAYANADDFFLYQGKPSRNIPDSEGYGLNALYRLYRASDGWIFLACPFEKEWQDLCETIGRENLMTDSRFTNSSQRDMNDSALIDELTSVFLGKKASEWEVLLTSRNVGCVEAESNGPYQFFSDNEHVIANEFITEVDHPRWGKHWRHNSVIRFSKTPGRSASGPLKGEHNHKILAELGYNENDINNMEQGKIIFAEEP